MLIQALPHLPSPRARADCARCRGPAPCTGAPQETTSCVTHLVFQCLVAHGFRPLGNSFSSVWAEYSALQYWMDQICSVFGVTERTTHSAQTHRLENLIIIVFWKYFSLIIQNANLNYQIICSFIT